MKKAWGTPLYGLNGMNEGFQLGSTSQAYGTPFDPETLLPVNVQPSGLERKVKEQAEAVKKALSPGVIPEELEGLSSVYVRPKYKDWGCCGTGEKEYLVYKMENREKQGKPVLIFTKDEYVKQKLAMGFRGRAIDFRCRSVKRDSEAISEYIQLRKDAKFFSAFCCTSNDASIEFVKYGKRTTLGIVAQASTMCGDVVYSSYAEVTVNDKDNNIVYRVEGGSFFSCCRCCSRVCSCGPCGGATFDIVDVRKKGEEGKKETGGKTESSGGASMSEKYSVGNGVQGRIERKYRKRGKKVTDSSNNCIAIDFPRDCTWMEKVG